MKNDILTVRNVNVSYKNQKKNIFSKTTYQHVLKDVSFEMKEGEILGLVGESGCGKSTLAKAILGLIPYTGEIVHVSKFPQMVFQDPYGSLNPSKTIGWIMEEPLRLRGPQGGELLKPAERKERVIAMLHRVGLDEKLVNRYPNQLSGGLELLKQLKEEMGLSILFISHDLRVVYQMCNRVMIMQKGRFVEMGTPDEIYFAPKDPYTKKLLESAGIE